MRSKNSILIILIFVLLLGLMIQGVRSEYIGNFSIKSNEALSHKLLSVSSSIGQNELADLHRETFLIIYNDRQEESKNIKYNFEKVLSYMKKDWEEITFADYKELKRNYSTIIVISETLEDFKGIDSLFAYTSKGGKLFFTNYISKDQVFYSIYRDLGIYESSDMKKTKGVRVMSDILIKGRGFFCNETFMENYSIPVNLEKRCNIHLKSEENIPLMWDVSYGSGKIMIFNGTMLREKINRGLITGALGVINEDFIYPIINIKLSYIDDFPAPIQKGYNDHIYKQYGRTTESFFREIWWADILKGAKLYNLKYNGFIIESYNDNTKPPFEFPLDADSKNLLVYGRELLRNGGELGIHGYNHQPLAEDGFIKQDLGYNSWNLNDITLAMEEFMRFACSEFPHYSFISYVPPSNILSAKARAMLPHIIKNLRVISSVYLNYDEEDIYTQEFEVADDGIVELPRLSQGYINTQENNWSVINAISTIGVYSHFIHPDDVEDNDRSKGKTWEELSSDYEKFLKGIYENYKWLRSFSVTEAAYELKSYLDTKVYIDHKTDKIHIYCNNFSKEMYFVLRTGRKINKSAEYEFTPIDMNTYLIHIKKPHVEIYFGR